MAKLLRLDVAQLTDVGRKREHNEDNMAYVIPKDPMVMAHKGALFIVADGMGGHAAGEVASEIAVDTVSNVYYQNDNDDVPAALLHAIRRANAAIHQRAAENMLRSGMGTTCVVAALRGNVAYVANVGDSRAYIIRKSRIRQVSQDHSWVAEQVRAGLLTEEQARTHAQRNVITRSLGTQPEVEIDLFREALEEGDTLILCSDGLSGLVSDEDLMRTVEQFMPQESVYHLVERANENGGPDNITAIVARVQELGAEPPNIRQPVPIGGPELSNEDTARLYAPVGAAGMNTTTRNGEIPVPGSPFPYSSGPLAAQESDTIPQPALHARKQRGRLFYPTLVLLVLFILAAGGSGLYYFLHVRDSQTVASALNNAEQLLGQARETLTKDPAGALQSLSQAQKQLQQAQGYTLDAATQTRLTALQNQLVSETRTAITNYNQTAKIALLPCAGSPPTSNGTPDVAALALAQIQIKEDVFTYALSQDGKIYQVATSSNQFTLTNSISSPDKDTHFLSVVSTDGKLVALSGPANTTSTAAFSINLLSPGTKGTLTVVKSQGIDQTLLPEGQAPTLLTASGNKIFVVVSAQTNSTSATLLSYSVNAKNSFSTAKKTAPISISTGISGLAVLSNTLFLLFASGEVQSMNITDLTLSTPPISVLVSAPLATPLSANAQTFAATTPVPTASSTSVKGKSSLRIQAPTANNPATMSAGKVKADNQVHLFIGDPSSHRVLDLVIQPVAQSGGPDATPSATETAGNSVTLELVQQYVSVGSFQSIKSVVTDPSGSNVSVLGQTSSRVENLVTVSAGAQQACVSQ